MDEYNFAEIPTGIKQLKKYAQDLAETYRKEKSERKKLEAANLQLKTFGSELNTIVTELKSANAELRDAYLDTIHRLVMAAEFKDEDTGDHINRTSRYCALIAEKLGLPGAEVDIIFSAAPMHDIGKVCIPDSILMKAGKLTSEEFDIIKTHTTAGAKILSNSKAKVIQVAEKIAVSHHEKWNGKGYPYGLAGEEIPQAGRIVGIIDVFDALTSIRPYKDPYPLEVALDIIKKERGEQFDPDIVDIFLKNIDAIIKIKNEVSSKKIQPLSEFTWSERDIEASQVGDET